MNQNALVLAAIIMLGIIVLKDRIPYIGNLPGDIALVWGNLTLYFPFTSTILILLIISFVRSASR